MASQREGTDRVSVLLPCRMEGGGSGPKAQDTARTSAQSKENELYSTKTISDIAIAATPALTLTSLTMALLYSQPLPAST